MSSLPWEGPVSSGAGRPQQSTLPLLHPHLQREMLLEELVQAADSEPLRPHLKWLTTGFQLGRGTRKEPEEADPYTPSLFCRL